jgi:hypothetical protein
MGLDWNPANKPAPGREQEYAILLAALEAEAESGGDESDEESAASQAFFAATISAFDTLEAPTIGVDEVANSWAQQQYEAGDQSEPFSIWFEKVRGLRLVHLAPECAGIPRYSNGSPAGYVEPFSFRAQFLRLCEEIIGTAALEQCYESKSPEELVRFGEFLRSAGLQYAATHNLDVPPISEEFDEDAPEWRADILIAAGDWCIFWGTRGHPLDPYW